MRCRVLPPALAIVALLATPSCSSDGKKTSPGKSERTANAGQPTRKPARPRARAGFSPPDRKERRRAIGLGDMAIETHRLYEPGDSFAPIRKPRPGDWLAEQREHGQTFAEYVRSRANRPDKKRRTIYILPLGRFSKDAPSFAVIARFARIYFGLPVRVLPAIAVAKVGPTERVNSGVRQILSTDVLEYLESHAPGDAYATIALTEVDLYPQASWNFVFGQASLRNRTGVYSLARYRPAFHGDDHTDPKLVLRRSLKVMAHETMHMFGIHHCIYFECVINGSNHLAETDARPLHACPVDLRKLQHAVGFDVPGRYRALARFYGSVGLAREQRWVKARLGELARE
jgi:archaemetzincin